MHAFIPLRRYAIFLLQVDVLGEDGVAPEGCGIKVIDETTTVMLALGQLNIQDQISKLEKDEVRAKLIR